MENILKIIGTVAAGVSWSGVLIGISSWLSSIWSNKIFEKEKNNLQKDIEDYKSKINKEMQDIKVKDEKRIFISKIIYEKEYELYQKIWKVLIECLICSKTLFPYKIEIASNDNKAKFNEKIEKFKDCFNEFNTIMHTNAPFYQQNIYDELKEIRAKCMELAQLYMNMETVSNSNEIKNANEKAQSIYIYLGNYEEKLRKEIQNRYIEISGESI